MKITPILNTASIAAIDKLTAEKPEVKQGRFDEFVTFMKRVDEATETENERAQRKAKDQKMLRQRREKERRTNQIQGRIAYLRSRVMANPEDKKAIGELSMAKTQLYWTNNPITSSPSSSGGSGFF